MEPTPPMADDGNEDERPGRLSPDALFVTWLMAATFLCIFAVIAAGYLTSFLLSGR